MTRVVALIPDLLFGSNVLGALSAAGIDAEQAASVDAAGERLAAASADVLVVDLTGDLDGAAALESLRAGGALSNVKTLAFYSHVDAEMRERALAAGFDLVVPRSRMAREGASLIAGLCRGG
ncbi:MAG: hypothetical protein ACYCU0_04585 [Solirubrobacteraceae bacterium]